jgi:hypothetical protein
MSKGGTNWGKNIGIGCLLVPVFVILMVSAAIALPLAFLGGPDESSAGYLGYGNAAQRLRGVPQSFSWPGPFPNGQYNSEYDSRAEANEWSPRSCGAASVTAVLRAFGIMNDGGTLMRISDVLDVAIAQGAIASPGGWQGNNKFEPVLDHFGNFVSEDLSGDMDAIIAKANEGYPVITSVRSSYVFTGGHILVIAGGTGDKIFLADSSGYWGGSREEIKIVDRGEFESMWRGNSSLGLVVYPEGYDPNAFGLGGDQPIPDVPNDSHAVRIGPVLARINPSLANRQGSIANVSRQDLIKMTEAIALEEGMPPALMIRQIYKESTFNPYADGVPPPAGDPYLGIAQQSATWAQSEAGITIGNRITDVEASVRAMCRGMKRYVDSQMPHANNNSELAFQRALAMYNWGPAHFPPLHMASAPYREDWLTCSRSSSASCAPEETKKYIGFIMYNDENKFM